MPFSVAEKLLFLPSGNLGLDYASPVSIILLCSLKPLGYKNILNFWHIPINIVMIAAEGEVNKAPDLLLFYKESLGQGEEAFNHC